MKIIDVPQGSALWHEHRRTHFNASDAPAMMGCSEHETRNQLLHRLWLQREGLPVPEPTDAEQALFAEGHRAERLARPLVEKLLGDDLYPLTKADGKLSASLDGQVLDGDIDWEHKLMRADLRAVIPVLTDPPICPAHIGKALPLMHRVQMAHQQHCSGAKRTLFSASEWDRDDQLLDARHCWYERDEALIAQVLAAWAQFEQDLAAYVPPEAVERAVAAPQDHLPAVSVQVSGALVVASNLGIFKTALEAYVAKIPKKPSTDQEFVDADAACKRLAEVETRLKATEDTALASMADVETMRRAVADCLTIARTTRLATEKMVKARKDQIREEEVRRGADALKRHILALNERLGGAWMPLVPADFPGCIKGLKTLDSVRNAIDTELARCKIEASATADRVDANLKLIGAAGAQAAHLFRDAPTLVHKATDDLQAIITTRVLAEAERLEAEHARIRAEEAARLEREAAAAAEPRVTGEQGHTLQDSSRELSHALSSKPDAMLHAREAAAAIAEQTPTLTLGTLCDRLGLTVSADLLARLGYPHTPARAAKMYRESDFAPICLALAAHLVSAAQ
jgi:predicted phage-related endonuclease